ncbi:MAG: hydantoinase/oxoprolinase family protein [Pseudomonadota bacterium]
MRLGVDVGGTNTDAVLMAGVHVKCSQKTPTTSDISDGIVAAVRAVLDDSRAAASSIETVMIGTTHFTNALVERRGLLPVGVIRIALPASSGVEPFAGWPRDLVAAVRGGVRLVRGGFHVDGRANAALDELAVRDAARDFKASGLRSIAISGMFAPVNNAMERRAAEIVREEIPDAAVTCSYEIGSLGLLERENAATMNACLRALATDVVASFAKALNDLDIAAPFFISQNDGTLMTADKAEQFPVLTFASGPTNSMRGAAYLSGVADALVADIGGTTTDIGMLVSGFPRESSVVVDIGGVRTNFRMPDILAIGLGGGSLVTADESGWIIGPRSVGYRLTREARVFGGKTLTTSDIAVAAGFVDMGDKQLVADLQANDVEHCVATVRSMVADGIDRMKTSAADVPLVLVGGGAVIIDAHVPGTSNVIVPDNASVANAVGASIAQVGAEIDTVYSYDAIGRETAMEAAQEAARQAAIDAGANAATITITSIDEIPLAYVPGGSVRLRVKAAGDLQTRGARPN